MKRDSSNLVRKCRKLLKFGISMARPKGDCVPAFILGAQRSGTTMMMRNLDHSLQVRVHYESSRTAMSDFRMRSVEEIASLIRNTRERVVAFKPIRDSQRAGTLLDAFPTARLLWVYRHFHDVANSSVKKWQGWHRDLVVNLLEKGARKGGWYGEIVTAETISAMNMLPHNEITEEEGACLFWYLRNSHFISLGLAGRQRVMLVKYEELVRNPGDGFARIFSFLGLPEERGRPDDIHCTSVGKIAAPKVSPGVSMLCEGLMNDLDKALQSQNV